MASPSENKIIIQSASAWLDYADSHFWPTHVATLVWLTVSLSLRWQHRGRTQRSKQWIQHRRWRIRCRSWGSPAAHGELLVCCCSSLWVTWLLLQLTVSYLVVDTVFWDFLNWSSRFTRDSNPGLQHDLRSPQARALPIPPIYVAYYEWWCNLLAGDFGVVYFIIHKASTYLLWVTQASLRLTASNKYVCGGLY